MKLTVPGWIGLTASALLAASAVPTTAAAAAQTTPAAWHAVTVPSSVQEPASLADVSAVSASVAWAVGAQAETGIEHGTPLILRWNGTAWSRVALSGVPAPGYLSSVAAGSATDAWAVGSDKSGAVALHWNGTTWRNVSFPGHSTATVNGVAVARGGKAWMVGSIGNNALVERWNGTAWHVVKTGLGAGELIGVRVAASGDVWVGGSNGNGQALVAREQRGTWTALRSPGTTAVTQVLEVSPNDVWTAGYTFNAVAGVLASVVAHWNGSAWSLVNAPGSVLAEGLSISPDGSGQPQWVGTESLSTTDTTYAHYNGIAWSTVSGATPLSGAFGVNAVTTHIPGTDATWAVGGLFNDNSSIMPGNALIEYNP